MTYQTQQQQIDRQRALATAIANMNQLPQGTSYAPGGLAVPTTGFSAAAKLFGQALGGYEGQKANQMQDAFDKTRDADLQQQSSGLMDAVAGPSRMQSQAADNAPPVGQTTSFDGSDPDAGTPVAQMQTDPNKPQVDANPKRAALSALLKGAQPEDVVNLLQGPALARFAPPKVQTLGDGAQIAETDPFTGKTTVSAENVKDIKPAAPDHSLVNIDDGKGGFKTIQRSNFVEGRDKLYEKPNQQMIIANGLTGNALDDAAQRYRLTGEMAPIGRNAAVAIKIQNRAADLADAAGDSATAAAIRQKAGKAAGVALNKFESQAQAVAGFEKLATKSADLAEQLSDKVGRTGAPILNEWIQSGRKAVTSAGDLHAFHAQNETFTSEYGKIMSGSMGNTALSDTAAKHARDLINTAMTPKDYHTVMATLRQDMANRIQSQSEQRSELYNAIGGNGEQIPGAAPPGAPTPPTPATAPAAAVPAVQHPEDIQALLKKYSPK